MTQANDPNNYDRQFRHFNRRLERLEDTLITPQEFDRVYEKIDALENRMNQRFDQLDGRFDELERKFDIVMRHITGQN